MVFYVTRETVKAALDIATTARMDAQVDRACGSATRAVRSLLHRDFVPLLATKYFDWPDFQGSRGWRLWFDEHEAISITSLVAGGQTIASSDYFLEPVNSGPPYDRAEINLASAASFNVGNTHQRNIAMTGLWGYNDDTEPAGALAEALDASETGVDVTDSSVIGVGDLIKVGTEYMDVTDRAMLDTGANLETGNNMAASNSDVSVPMGGTLTNPPQVGEVILIDSERMLVVDKAGAALTVKRAYDGTVLAAHTGGAGAHIYAPRTLTVLRGARGSTAATHSVSAAIERQVFPDPVRDLAAAYAVNQVQQETAAYARVAGQGDNAREFMGRGIADIEKQARRACGRQMRIGAV